MKKSRKVIFQAIDELIAGYGDNTLIHNTDSCPLCKIYHGLGKNKKYNCGRCLNHSFSNEYIPCVNRGYLFKNLSITSRSNNQTLLLFWQDVRDYLMNKKYSDIIKLTPEIKQGIFEIGNKYK